MNFRNWFRSMSPIAHSQRSLPRPSQARLFLEGLEARRTPATLVGPKTVTFQDLAGDNVTVAFSRPVLTASNADSVFKFDTGSVNSDNTVKQQLQEIDLTGLPKSLTVTVTGVDVAGKAAMVDVGWVNAAGVDEVGFNISGDVGRVLAGDTQAKTPGLRSLVVGSMGTRGTATQAAGGDLKTAIQGSLGKLTVTGDVVGEIVSVAGRIGKVTIGGSLSADPTSSVPFNGSLQATMGTSSVAIAGNIVGGPVTGSGSLQMTNSSVSKITVKGSLIGDAGKGSGSLTLAGCRVASIVIGGDLVGGIGPYTGMLIGGTIGAVSVTNIIGGDGDSSGSLWSVGLSPGGGIGTIHIRENVEGGSGKGSADIRADSSSIGSVFVGGSVIGGTGLSSASIFTHGNIGRVSVTGSWTGASIAASVDEGNDGYYGTIDDRFVAQGQAESGASKLAARSRGQRRAATTSGSWPRTSGQCESMGSTRFRRAGRATF